MFPHNYIIHAAAQFNGDYIIEANQLPSILTAPPPQFGGPGDMWSPELLLVAAVADCFMMTFRAISKASKFDWLTLSCDTKGVLDKLGGIIQFTKIFIEAKLQVSAETDQKRAKHLLERAEQSCLVSNSLKADRHLTTQIEVGS